MCLKRIIGNVNAGTSPERRMLSGWPILPAGISFAIIVERNG